MIAAISNKKTQATIKAPKPVRNSAKYDPEANKVDISPKARVEAALGDRLNQPKRLELFMFDRAFLIQNLRAGRNSADFRPLVGACIANRLELTAHVTDGITAKT